MNHIALLIFASFVTSIFMATAQGEELAHVFPEPPATLDIRPAVEIGFQTERRFGYVVQSSSNLTTWIDLPGSILSGSGEPVYRLFRATPGVKTFYRLKRIPVMFGLPNFSCGQTAILMWRPESGFTNVLTFPVPGRFEIVGGARGIINEVDRDLNTLKFAAEAERYDSFPVFFDGDVYFKFETEVTGQYAIKSRESGETHTGRFSTMPHDPVRGTPPRIESGLTGKTLLLDYCPNGHERFEFKSATDVAYKDSWPNEPVGTYSYDSVTGELTVTFSFGWEFQIKFGSELASVTFREAAAAPSRTDHATFRIY